MTFDTMNANNNDDNDDEWDTRISSIDMSDNQPRSNEEFMVIKNDNGNNAHNIDITRNNLAHNPECVAPIDIVACSATFYHPNKVTIADGITVIISVR